MWSIETDQTFPLSAVKPFDGLAGYRQHCLDETRRALKDGGRRRERSPVTGSSLLPFGMIEGFEYLRCPDTGSIFLAELPLPPQWTRLLAEVSCYRHSRETFHAGIAQTRGEHVYTPKLDWIRSTLRMQHLENPAVLDVVTPPSDIASRLEDAGIFSRVETVDEMALVMGEAESRSARFGTAILFESLDRVDDPEALLRAVVDRLAPGGLLFVTSLVCSGFDVAVLGLKNLYLYPPDRTNCFSLGGLERLLKASGLALLEVSTPGVLDVEIIQTHLRRDPSLPLSTFERQLLEANLQTRESFQAFLQQHRMSSFARIIGRKA